MRVSNLNAMTNMAGHGEFLFKVTSAKSDGDKITVAIVVRGGAQFDLTFSFKGVEDDLPHFREFCSALGLSSAPEDESEILDRRAYIAFPTHGGLPRFSEIERLPFPYPSEPAKQFAELQGNESTLYARRQARDIRTRRDRRAHGYGLLFEIENGRISGVSDCDHSPVLWVEGEVDLDFEGTRRRGLRLVEWFGKDDAPANASRWAADIFCADFRTAAFVRAAIEEKLANDHGIAFASGEVGR